MALYRKMPIIVHAVQWQPGDTLPEWAVIAGCKEWNPEGSVIYLTVQTLEGRMVAKPGDFIIQGAKGEVYPCKPDIFAMTYEAVDVEG